MKAIVCIIDNRDVNELLIALTDERFEGKAIGEAGASADATVIISAKATEVDAALAIIEQVCHVRTQYNNPLPPTLEPGEVYAALPEAAQVGGAMVFVLDADVYHF